MKVKKIIHVEGKLRKNNTRDAPVLKEKTVDEVVEEWATQSPRHTGFIGRVFTQREKELIIKSYPLVDHNFLAKQMHCSKTTLVRYYHKWSRESMST